MARPQVYRGDPELKQVVLFDNFSGGINTTDIDEQVATNEFRMLENVELMEQGRVAKRKGFTNLKIGRELNIYGGINDVIHVDVLYDENNNFNTYDYDEFESKKVPHYIIAAVIRFNTNTKTMNMLELILRGRRVDGEYTIEVEEYSEEIETAEKQDDYEFYDKHMKITGLRTNNYNGKTYFLANQVIKNSESVISYELGENKRVKIEISNKENSYAPNPYELTNSGFNVFSNSPHSHISSITQSTEDVQGVIIIDKDNKDTVLSNYPRSGEFILRVYYTGSQSLIDQLIVEFYVEDNTTDNGKRTLKSSVDKIPVEEGVGYFDYLCTIPTSTTSEIFVNVRKEFTDDPKNYADKVFNSSTEMIDYFDNIEGYMKRVSQGTYDIYSSKADTKYQYETKKIKIYGWDNPEEVNIEFETKNIPFMGIGKYTQSGEFRELLDVQKNGYFDGKPLGFKKVILCQAYDEEEDKYTGLMWYDVAIMSNIGTPSNPIVVPTLSDRDNNEKYTPLQVVISKFKYDNWNFILESEYDFKINTSKIYYVSDEQIFYKWNSGETGTLDDFTEVEIEITTNLIDYTQTNSIGNNEERGVEPVKFDKLKGTIIKDRLVLYGGNTFVYSDVYSRQKDSLGNEQGFTYFPNYNWVTLPLETSDSLQSIVYYRGSYMIFTKKSIYRMSGEFNTDSFEIVMVSDVVGCVSPDSIRGMNNTIIFMSEDGLYTLKQNYYLDGLENVGKIDKNITGLIPYGENYESLIYNEQYWLFVKEPDGTLIKVIKQYYNLDLRDKQHPYTIDTYGTDHMLMFRNGIDLYVVYEGEFFRKGIGYLDFVIVDDIGTPYEVNWAYDVIIETPYWSLGYPLHEKKFKNVYLKANSVRKLPVYFDVLVDFGDAITSNQFDTKINIFGEVEYTFNRRATLETMGIGTLGELEIGKDTLGDAVYQVHKINPSTKGKTIKFRFEQGDPSEFSVDAISIVYKLGKMRESR